MFLRRYIPANGVATATSDMVSLGSVAGTTSHKSTNHPAAVRRHHAEQSFPAVENSSPDTSAAQQGGQLGYFLQDRLPRRAARCLPTRTLIRLPLRLLGTQAQDPVSLLS